ncbi:ComGF family competence protein [Alkalibacillus aidingensis]|uniref:ComGF family competence protein n=1 Tax=Alkalibacillus aidingensis TaxID=2747607 RepID=UPI001660F86B|nr:ComGF family competence protein [Alkalibacillus aidingensis]
MSLLISLSILIVITPMIFPVLKMTEMRQDVNHQSHLELRQFDFLIAFELNRSKVVKVSPDKLRFYKHNGDQTVLEKYDGLVRRRVNGTGHEVMIFDVDEFKITMINDHTFTIYCKRKDGSEFEKVYSHRSIDIF